MKKHLPLLLTLLITLQLSAQQTENPWYRNRISLQLNNHLEKRGTDQYETSNPDLILTYERDIFSPGIHHLGAGIRTGAYREYVLTGNGWEHPVRTRFFLGASPYYAVEVHKHIWLQLNFIYDVLLPDDYDEIWSYWAVEPSVQFRMNHFYAGLSATNGVFLFFDPRAWFAKAGIKAGVCF